MNDQNNRPFASSGEVVFSTFMQRVYQWMAMGLMLTAFTAFLTVQSAGLMRLLAGGGMWVIFIAQLGIVFWLSAGLRNISPQAAVLGFLTYSMLTGIMFAGIFLIYTAASIAATFFITAMTFGGVSVFGWATKQDLTSVGHFCGMALWGVIVASLVNIFFRPLLSSPAKGASTAIWLATAGELSQPYGGTYRKCKPRRFLVCKNINNR